MAKKDNIFQRLASKHGGEVLSDSTKAKYFIDTGNLAINYLCSGKFISGGVPGGRLSEIFGPSASSKSLIGTNILHGCQKLDGVAAILDTENAISSEFVQKASHCDINRVVRYTPKTLEEAFATIYQIIEEVSSDKDYKDKPLVIIYDSITVSPCARELREIKLPLSYTKADFKRIVGANEQPGERAKIYTKEFRKLNTKIEETGATVVVMNQTREKIGMYGNPETTPGGKALEFYASLRIRPQTQKKIEKTLIGKKKKCLGIFVKMQNKKNRSFRPFVECDQIPLLFDRGINPLGGLLGALLDADRIVSEGKGRFTIKDKWSGGGEATFRSSMERNDVPLDVLFKYPSLIDAVTKEEIEEYLRPFKDAIDFDYEGEGAEIINVGEDEDVDEELDEELS